METINIKDLLSIFENSKLVKETVHKNDNGDDIILIPKKFEKCCIT